MVVDHRGIQDLRLAAPLIPWACIDLAYYTGEGYRGGSIRIRFREGFQHPTDVARRDPTPNAEMPKFSQGELHLPLATLECDRSALRKSLAERTRPHAKVPFKEL